MGRDFTNRPRKRPRKKEWWEERYCKFRVYHSEEFSYLVHFSFVGHPTIWAYCPRCWGLRNPGHFDTLFFRGALQSMKKPLPQSAPRPSLAASVDDLVERFPTLADFLASTCYDGDPPGTRCTGTLLVFAQDGSWKACLRDRQESRCLWVASLSLFELFTVLEAALSDPAAVWRYDRMDGHEQAKRIPPKKKT